MSLVNHSTKEITAKIVYYGPGRCGKTTNLQYVFSRLPEERRGKIVSLATEKDRTLFFDFLPLDVGPISGFQTRFQLYTVPGQVYYNATRRLVLQGADGVVFVADSQRSLMDENRESLDNLRENLSSWGMTLEELPLVFQYNKRDLDDLIPVETFNQLLNPQGLPYVEASAINGVGVFETLKEVAKLTVPAVKEKVLGIKVGAEELAAAESRAQEVVREATQKDVEVEFVSPQDEGDSQLKKMKLRTIDDVEQELDRLSREFLERPKKTEPS